MIVIRWNIENVSLKAIAFKKNVKSKEAVDDDQTPVQMPDKKTVKILLQELQKRTGQDSIKIQIEENRKPTLFESKLGGVPYWDGKRKYPMTSGGSSLIRITGRISGEFFGGMLVPV